MKKNLPLSVWVRLRTRVSTGLTLGLVAMWMSASGCSLGSLFGNGKDEGVLKTKHYRKINADCGFKADSPILDVPTFRSVLKCFNANHAMDRIVALFDQLDDEQLKPIVDAGNQYVLNNPKRLYELEKTHSALKTEKISTESLKQFGKLLKNGEFISNSIALLKDGIFVSANTITPSAPADKKVPDPLLLKALELVGHGISNQNIEKTIATSLNISGAASFHDLHRNFKKGLQSTPSLRLLTDGVHAYLKSTHTYACDAQNPAMDLKEEFFELVRNQWLMDAFEKIFDIQAPLQTRGSFSDPLKARVAEVSLVLEALSKDAGNSGDPSNTDELIKKLGVAFQKFSEPFYCLNQGVVIANPTLLIVKELIDKHNQATQAGRNISAELARYVLKDNPLNFTLLNDSVCQLPTRDLQEHYATLKDLVRLKVTDATASREESFLAPMTGVLKSAYEIEKPWLGCDKNSPQGTYHPLISFLTHFMADLDPNLGVRDRSDEQKKGLDYLIPLFKEFSSRDVWADLLLVATVPGDQDRSNFEGFGKFLVDRQVELGNKSIAEVLLNALERASHPVRFYQFVWSLRNYVNIEDNFLEEALLRVRDAYYINNVHPITDLLAEILKNSSQNADLITSIFALSGELKVGNGADVRNYFSEALEEVADMAEDGRLEELMDAVISINSQFAAKAKDQVNIVTHQITPFVPSRRHNFQKSDLQQLKVDSGNPFQFARFNIPQECDLLDYSVSLKDTQNPQFDRQLNAFLNCLNGTGHYSDLIQGIDLLRARRLVTERYRGTNKTLYDFTFELTSDLFRAPLDYNDQGDFEYLKDSWLSFYQRPNRGFYRLLEGANLVMNGIPADDRLAEQAFGSLLPPLMKVGGRLATTAQSSLAAFQNFGAKILRSDEFPKLLSDLRAISKATPVVERNELNLNPNQDPFVARVLNEGWNGPVGRPFNAEFINTLKHWVQNKECSDLPMGAAALEEELVRRVVRILNDARDNVNNYETRKKWDNATLGRWVEPLLNKLSNPQAGAPERSPLDAQLNFLKYFALPEGNVRYDWGNNIWPQFSPEWLMKWFYERSIDYRPILYFYPGAEFPVVRIINTLGAFEAVTKNSDFIAPPPISENLGLRNLALLAEAWGDVPQNAWPHEIREKYRNLRKQPLTIAQAVEEMTRPKVQPFSWDPRTWGNYFLNFVGMNDLETLSRVWIGLPKLPACMRPVQGEPYFPPVRPTVTIIGETVFNEELQKRLFNLWQTRDVMEDNIPGRPAEMLQKPTRENGYRTGYDGGLEFFRNLFFELLYSSPVDARGFKFEAKRGSDANNLTVISYSNHIGILNIISKLFRNISPNDPALKDGNATLVHSATIPEFKNAMRTLLSSRDGRKVVDDLIFNVLRIVNEGSPAEIDQMKKLGYYLLASMNRIDPWTPSAPVREAQANHELRAPQLASIFSLLFENLDSTLKDQNLLSFLANSEGEVLMDAMTSRSLSSFAQQLYTHLNGVEKDADGRSETGIRLTNLLREFLEEKGADQIPLMTHGMKAAQKVYESRKSKINWRTFLLRSEALIDSQAFKDLNLEEAALPLLLFFEESDLNSEGQVRKPHEKEFARRLRRNLARVLESGKLNEVLLFAHENPEDFDRLLRAGAKYLDQNNFGDLEEFFQVLNGRLSAPVH